MENLVLEGDEGPSILAKIRDKNNIKNLILAILAIAVIIIGLSVSNTAMAQDNINFKASSENSEVYVECLSQKEPKIGDIEALNVGKSTIFTYNKQSQLTQCFPKVSVKEKVKNSVSEPQKQQIDILDPYKILAITTNGDNVQMSFEKRPDECDDSESDVCLARKVFKQELIEMVEGHPIEAMLDELVKRDRMVAAFVIGIGKKESNWGKRVPTKNGQDCYNYWGYRGGEGENGEAMGYTCFSSPEEAVNTIADRIDKLVNEYDRNTPSRMVVWKCGSTCAAHDPFGVQKWISDVQIYYNKIYSNKVALK